MDRTRQHSTRDVEQELDRSPFRKYGWVLAVLAVILLALCSGIGLLEAADGYAFLSRLRGGGLSGPAPTFIPAQSDLPTATSTQTASPAPTDVTPPSEAPTSTATATGAPAFTLTCRCNGANYVCSDGSATYNSPRCAPQVTPTCSCKRHDWVCSDGARSVNDIRCGLVCQCQGNDLYCNDGSVAYYNPQCACTCDGTTMVCNDGGRQANAEFCGGKKKNK